MRSNPSSVSVVALLVAFSVTAAAQTAEPLARLPGHRNLFNGDCNFLFGDAFVVEPTKPYDPQTFAWFIDLLADSGVDTYVNNPTAQLPWYPSKRTPNILTGYRRGDLDFVRGHYPRGTPPEKIAKPLERHLRTLDRQLDLVEADVDWVTEISKACRRRGISPWLSIRMNDMHGGGNWDDAYMNCPLQRDPKYRLDGRNGHLDGVNPMWQALDYAHPEVRDYMLTMIRELVEDYDYEGLELDWLRCSFCLNASEADFQRTAMITAWHAEIRKVTEAQAKKTGKPYPLGLRIPCRLEQLKAIGLDVKAMVDAGLIDFVNFSNFFQTTWDVPYDELRKQLGDKVAIYGVIEAVPNWLEGYDPTTKTTARRDLPASPEFLRGNAAGKLAAGVDGIETFNFFVADQPPHRPQAAERRGRYPLLRDLSDLEKLRGQPKQYALASRVGGYQFPLYELAEQVPVTIEAECKQSFRLTMAAEPTVPELIVQVITDGDVPGPLGISFNGSTPHFISTKTDHLLFPCANLTHHLPQHRAYNFHFPLIEVRDGWNEVLVFNGTRTTPSQPPTTGAIRVLNVELAVKPRKKD